MINAFRKVNSACFSSSHEKTTLHEPHATHVDVEYTYLNDTAIQYKFLTDKMSFLLTLSKYFFFDTEYIFEPLF